MIKGKPSYPFETIALAVAFTPLLEAFISETSRLSESFGAKVVFIHPGKRIEIRERQLAALLHKYNFSDTNSSIVWAHGNPIDAILSTCKDETVDLLITSGFEKDDINYFTREISNEIALKAKCSVLLIVDPKVNGLPHRQTVVNGLNHPKTMHSIETAIYFASKERAREITIADGVSISQSNLSVVGDYEFADADETSIEEIFKDEFSRLNNELRSIDSRGLKINIKTFSTRQLNLSRFAKNMTADLLVVNSSDHHLSIFDRISSNDVEELLTDLPCNTLIVHSRVY